MRPAADGVIDRDLFVQALGEVEPGFAALLWTNRAAALDVAGMYYRLLGTQQQAEVLDRYAQLLGDLPKSSTN
jgi:hypothetical protein